jgi:hypothetical protein
MRPEERHIAVARATVTDLPQDAALSHISASAVQGRPTWNGDLSRVHVTRAGATGRQTRRTHVHGAALPEDMVEVVDGLRITAPARTVVDLGRTLGFEYAVAVGDSALHDGIVDRDALDAALAEGKCRHGIGEARRAVSFLDGRSESVGESRSRVMFARNGIALPELQPDIFGPDGEWLARPDFCWRERGVIGEFDGRAKFLANLRPGQRPEDVLIAEKIREDALRAAGWWIVRWMWVDLADPAKVLRELRYAFANGRPNPSPLRLRSR